MKNFLKSFVLGASLCAPVAVSAFVGVAQSAEVSLEQKLGDMAASVFKQNIADIGAVKNHSWLEETSFSESLKAEEELLRLAHKNSDLVSQQNFLMGNSAKLKELVGDESSFMAHANALIAYKSYLTLFYGKNQFDKKFVASGKSGQEDRLKMLFDETFNSVSDTVVVCAGIGAGNMFKNLKTRLFKDWVCYCVHTNLLPGEGSLRKSNSDTANNSDKINEPGENLKSGKQSVSVVDAVLNYEEEMLSNGELVKTFKNITKSKIDELLKTNEPQKIKLVQNIKVDYQNWIRLVGALEKDCFSQKAEVDFDEVLLNFSDYIIQRNAYAKNDAEIKFDETLMKLVSRWTEANVIKKDESFEGGTIFRLVDCYIDIFNGGNEIDNNVLEKIKKMFNRCFNGNYFKDAPKNNRLIGVFDATPYDEDVVEDIGVARKDLGILHDFLTKKDYSERFKVLTKWRDDVFKKFKESVRKRKEISTKLEVAYTDQYNYDVEKVTADIFEQLTCMKQYLLRMCFLDELELELIKEASGDNNFSLFN